MPIGPRQHNITSQALQQVVAESAKMPRCEPDRIEQLQEEVSNHHYLCVQSKGRDNIDADYSVVAQFRDKLYVFHWRRAQVCEVLPPPRELRRR